MSASTTMIIAATLLVPLTTTTTAAYAQQQGKACPEGFELNKGRCQAAPTVLPGECPDSVGTVVTVPEEVEEGQCRTANTGAFTNPLFIEACNEVGGVIVQAFPESGHCLFPVPAGETICETGTLNEESGLCEIKPGNRRNV